MAKAGGRGRGAAARAQSRAAAPSRPPAAPARSPPDHRAVLRAWLETRRQRWTDQREAVLEAFLASREHLTSEELHRRVVKKAPDVGLSTVYRTLRLFVDAGVASERHFQDGIARYEPVQPHHDHLICLGCRAIVEFEDDAVERLQEQVAATHGYRLVSHRHELYGYCRACAGA